VREGKKKGKEKRKERKKRKDTSDREISLVRMGPGV
jgi:hypothetical protein